jgi:hypothetical protein
VIMVEIPPDNYDNLYYHQSDDGHPPLENIMGKVQHQQATVSSATPESDQENDGNEALNTANPSANNYYLLNLSETILCIPYLPESTHSRNPFQEWM